MNIVKNIDGENKKRWDRKIKYSLWEEHTTIKTYTKKTLLNQFTGWRHVYL